MWLQIHATNFKIKWQKKKERKKERKKWEILVQLSEASVRIVTGERMWVTKSWGLSDPPLSGKSGLREWREAQMRHRESGGDSGAWETKKEESEQITTHTSCPSNQ